jgi:hypothetical protein
MVSNPPKVSFIPKNPFVREEAFLMRRRPRSITGFLAIFAFVASVGSYVGLYLYQETLSKDIAAKTESIASMQREFLQSPEINKAKVFKARADLARELLNQHIVISPVFAFLSGSTLGSILYDSFSFKRDKDTWTLVLTGEAPSYASLASQSDVLNKKSKENEFVSFSINNIALTKSGTVTFTLSVDFAQSQLSYTKKSLTPKEGIPLNGAVVPVVPPVEISPSSAKKIATSTAPSVGVLPVVPSTSRTATVTPQTPSSVATTSAASGWTVTPVVAEPSTPKAATPTVTPAPAKSSFWSWFKFW